MLHRSSALNKSLGKRKRSSGVPKGRKKGTTTSKTAAKGKEIAQDDQGDQPPVMVCSPWYSDVQGGNDSILQVMCNKYVPIFKLPFSQH